MSHIFVANWKMELSIAGSPAVAREVEAGVGGTRFTGEVILCPSFPALSAVAPALKKVFLGAQDCGWQEHGAFTGVVSAAQLVEIHCRFVIVGHSERRRFCGETDELIGQKVHMAHAAGLTPILCVGETAQERRAGQRDIVLFRQVHRALEGIELSARTDRVLIAYEPVWVIGRGQAVEPDDISHAREVITAALKERYGRDKIERAVRMLYGGSVDAGNIAAIVSGSGMDGVLVGSASLKAANVLSMLSAMA